MTTIPSRQVAPRNPFRIEELPFLIRLDIERQYGTSKLARRWGEPIARAAAALPLEVRGTARFTNANLGRSNAFTFNAKNSQFHALYYPKFANGYEKWLCALLDWLVPDDGIFIDAGSNWGYFGLYLASRPGFRGRTYCFEPFPTTFRDLVDTVKQCDLEEFVFPFDVGLSDESGAGKMQVPGVQSGIAEVVAADVPGASDVRLSTLDDVYEQNGITRADFIKYDVEGSESRAISGSEETLATYKPMVVFEAWKHDGELTKTMGSFYRLELMGYRLFLPAWEINVANKSIYLGQDENADNVSDRIALVPFRWEERNLYPHHLNFFGCHEDRLEVLFDKGKT